MQTLSNFLAMGGYASFVWPAYATAAAVLGALFLHSRSVYCRRQQELERLEPGPGRRGGAS